jgi:hypothetical protein
VLVIPHGWVSKACKNNHPEGQCYILVVAFGAYGLEATASQYTIMSNLQDSTMTLSDGVPVREVSHFFRKNLC